MIDPYWYEANTALYIPHSTPAQVTTFVPTTTIYDLTTMPVTKTTTISSQNNFSQGESRDQTQDQTQDQTEGLMQNKNNGACAKDYDDPYFKANSNQIDRLMNKIKGQAEMEQKIKDLRKDIEDCNKKLASYYKMLNVLLISGKETKTTQQKIDELEKRLKDRVQKINKCYTYYGTPTVIEPFNSELQLPPFLFEIQKFLLNMRLTHFFLLLIILFLLCKQ
jgi:hypothetical protein